MLLPAAPWVRAHDPMVQLRSQELKKVAKTRGAPRKQHRDSGLLGARTLSPDWPLGNPGGCKLALESLGADVCYGVSPGGRMEGGHC